MIVNCGYCRQEINRPPSLLKGKNSFCNITCYGLYLSTHSANENGNNWKGGEWKWVKKHVLKRDNHTCAVCGLHEEGLMDVDHIKPRAKFPELRLDLKNLWTLCPNCHRRKSISDKHLFQPWNKGKKVSPKIRATMNLSGLEIGRKYNKGKKFSEEHRRRLSESHIGQAAWNKGMKFEYKERPCMKGKIPWNKIIKEVSTTSIPS